MDLSNLLHESVLESCQAHGFRFVEQKPHTFKYMLNSTVYDSLSCSSLRNNSRHATADNQCCIACDIFTLLSLSTYKDENKIDRIGKIV